VSEDLQHLIVHLDPGATDAEVEAVEEAVRSSGLTAEVHKDWQKEPGTGNGAFWMVAIDILRESISDFIGGLGVVGTVALLTQLRHARRSAAEPDGLVELRNPDGTQLLLTGEAAEEAFENLRQLGPEAHGHRRRWDERARQWVPY
jgi:hypothetical protein